jgi:hypothetical protein
MKKTLVFKKPVDNTVNVADASYEKYYGIKLNKVFVTKSDYHNGYYRVAMLDSLTEGNSTIGCSNDKHRDLIEFLRSYEGGEVYQFDTWQELFKWLLE